MNANRNTETLWHLWVVGAVALLFTLFGGYDYYMSQTGDRDYMAAAMAPSGVDVDAALEYYGNFPLWMEFVWAIGVWGAVAGSVLLLLRSRYAYPLYVISLTGFVISNAYGFANPIPGLENSAATFGVVAVVFVVMLLLTLYARSMRAKGVLR